MINNDELLRTTMFEDFADTVAILGAGFSVPAGVPPTSRISEKFLTHSRRGPTPEFLQEAMSKHLAKYWELAFSYTPGGKVPSFEDHFTLIDIAANAGHNLGPYLAPAALRALRRISIHRVFDILDEYGHSPALGTFLDRLAGSKNAGIVSLNWDIIAENHLFTLGHSYHYGIPGEFLVHRNTPPGALPLIKLHGSANWQYCDSCHGTLFGEPGGGKTALHELTFIEPRDFRVLGEDNDFVEEVERAKSLYGLRACRRCGNGKLSARVATFSYAKAFNFFLFQAAWDSALWELMQARQWIFIGYSLPEADFAFRHLLKLAELNSRHRVNRNIWVILNDDRDAAERFKRFFGMSEGWISQEGIEDWVAKRILPA